jgi:hypothetical protein
MRLFSQILAFIIRFSEYDKATYNTLSVHDDDDDDDNNDSNNNNNNNYCYYYYYYMIVGLFEKPILFIVC